MKDLMDLLRAAKVALEDAWNAAEALGEHGVCVCLDSSISDVEDALRDAPAED